MSLWHIVYVSSSSFGYMSKLELEEILRKSVESNKINGITGMLLYFAGTFMQVIEGSENNVKKLFSEIETDPRHKGVIVLLSDEIERRTFSRFSMDCKELTEHNFHVGSEYKDFLHDGFASNYFVEHPSIAFELIKTFRENCKKFSIF